MFDNHRTRSDDVNAASNPVTPRDERVAAALIAGYILQLAKSA